MIKINTGFFEQCTMAQAFQTQSLSCRSVQGSRAFKVMQARIQSSGISILK